MSIADLRRLPPDEKLRILEVLWGDLAADEVSFESPPWHEEVLRRTEQDFDDGKVSVLDWEEAKKELRSRFE